MPVHGLHSPVLCGREQIVLCMFQIRIGFCTQDVRMVCWFLCWSGQVTSEPPKSQSNVHLNYSSEAKETTSDVQRDQSAPPSQQGKTEGVHSLPTTTANPPTDPPFISFPVTTTPGTSISNTFFSPRSRLDWSLCV